MRYLKNFDGFLNDLVKDCTVGKKYKKKLIINVLSFEYPNQYLSLEWTLNLANCTQKLLS